MRLYRAAAASALVAVCAALVRGPAESRARGWDASLLIRILMGRTRGRLSGNSVDAPIKPGQEFKTFAYYAQAAYTVGNTWDCVPSCQQSETVGTVLDYTWHNISPASVGFLGHNNRTRIIVVSFRGTKDVDDWVQDSEFSLDAWPPHVPGSMVHHGFLSAYQSVATGVMREIVRLAARHPTYRIVFTGHSLGGAEAVLCAVDTLHRHPELVHRTHIYTYGMPRIGNSDWADSVEGLGIPVYRVVYENDMVVHIPFQWLGYTHFAQEVWIHRNRTVFCGAKTRESPVCSAGVSLSDYSIADHSQYTEADWMFVLQGSRVV